MEWLALCSPWLTMKVRDILYYNCTVLIGPPRHTQ